MPKLRLNLRLTQTEFDFLCRYARENGEISLNAAAKQIINTIRRIGAKTVPTSCGEDVIQ